MPPRFSGKQIVVSLAALKFLFQMAVAGWYGYAGDEFYFIDCSRHMQWGYYDHPPLVAGLMWLTRHTFGESLLGIRIVPALLGALLVWIVGGMTRDLGGGRFAQGLAALAVLASPVSMMFFHFFSMNAVEPVIWAGCAWLAIRALHFEQPRTWIAFGVLSGIGLENKYSTAIFLGAFVVGLLLSSARRTLASAYFWIGMLLAFLIFLPNFLWLQQHNFPFLQWQSGSRQRGDYLEMSFLTYFGEQFLLAGTSFVLCLAGIWFHLVDRERRRECFLALTVVFVYVIFFLLGGRVLYPTAVYALAFPGGALLMERRFAGHAWIKATAVLALAIPGALLAPCYVPILPIERVARYEAALHLPLPVQIERYRDNTRLPIVFAFETGWPNFVEKVAEVYHRLPPEDRIRAGILSFNYEGAGAIDVLGPKLGLPPAISTHMTYHLWGPRDYHGEVLILVGYRFPPSYCRSFEPGAMVENPYTYNNVGLTGPVINVCRGLKFDLQKQWGGLPWY